MARDMTGTRHVTLMGEHMICRRVHKAETTPSTRKASVSGSARCGVPSLGARPAPRPLRSLARAAKELHFNGDGEALKRMQRGVERLASVVGVTLGPKGRNVVLESRFGSPRIVNDGVTVAREVELEDAVENVGAKLVRQAAAKTNDVAGDGTTTATILAAAMIAEGMKIVAAGVNPVQVVRGMERTVKHLVGRLASLSSPVSDAELKDVATVSAGGNEVIGALIAEAMSKVGREGVVSMEESKTAEDSLEIVEGMQFDRGFISPYFVTDPERGVAEYDDARLLLVDKKVASARELVGALEAAVRGAYPLVIVAEDVEQEALATLVVNKLRGALRVVAVKAPGFGERRTSYLEDLAVLTGGQVVSDALGTSLDKVGEEFLGRAARVTVSKDRITVVGRAGDSEVASAVAQRVASVRRAAEAADSDYEREKLQERVAKLAGGVALVRVGAQTETELKEKKLRVEDALNATKAAVEEGIVTGGGCTLLRLASCVAELRSQLANDEQRMGADVVARALSAPLKLIAANAGGNGAIVAEKVAEHAADARYGYNAATGQYGDLLAAGIVDPAKVVRCALENASSVARTFLTSSVVVTEIPQPEPAMPQGGGGGEFGY